MSAKTVISIGCDHAGLELRNAVITAMDDIGFIDHGCFSDGPTDYPDIAALITKDIQTEKANFGILICGTGIGMCIAANRNRFARAALCYDEETARLSREHNDANIVCLGARKTTREEAIRICRKFCSSRFSGGRHCSRVEKLGSIGFNI